MAGLFMNMGLGGAGNAAGYAGPVYGADGPAAVPGSGGYGDTGRGTIAGLAFGPSGTMHTGPEREAGHAMVFGLACFAVLLFMAWALPR